VARAGAERVASIGSGRGGSGQRRRGCDGGWRGGIEHAVGRRTEEERVGVECVVVCGGFEISKGGGGERVVGAGKAVWGGEGGGVDRRAGFRKHDVGYVCVERI